MADALGMIETRGFVAMVEAADAETAHAQAEALAEVVRERLSLPV